MSVISKEILARHEESDDARKTLAFWLAGVPKMQSPTRYLLYAAWFLTNVGVTITSGFNEEQGRRAADAVLERFYARRRERNFIRRLDAA